MQTEYKIRQLKWKDLVFAKRIIKKLVEVTGDEKITRLFNSGKTSKENSESEKKDIFLDIGIQLLQVAMELLTEDVSVWFAELLGVDDISELPIWIGPSIIEQLTEAEEVNVFFIYASRLSRKIESFRSK